MEAFVHNLNTMNSRAGAQVPFSSVNYGTDTSAEGRMVMRNLLLATEAGLGNGETSIFPVQIFKVKEGVNYNDGDPNYDLFKLAMHSLGQAAVPQLQLPGCALQPAVLQARRLRHAKWPTWAAAPACMGNVYDPDREVTCGRGNLSFTSINLPRLGIEAKGDPDRFFAAAGRAASTWCIRQLLHRFEIQCSKKVRNYPFLMGTGRLAGLRKAGLGRRAWPKCSSTAP